MDRLLLLIFTRLRPRVGWLQFMLALSALLCIALAATTSPLKLPSAYIGWASTAGLMLGLWLGRNQPVAATRWPWRVVQVLRRLLLLGALAFLGALLVAVAADTLPPSGLITQDLAAYTTWLQAALRRTTTWAERPEPHALPFMAATLTRFWNNLLAAPGAGEAGARLMVLTGSIIAGWGAALGLGWALARGYNLFVWILLPMAALAFTTLLGGSDGIMLSVGLALLLLLVLVHSAHRRDRQWDARGTDYAADLRFDAITWGTYGIVLIILVVQIIPTTLSNPIADFFWRDVELPSGIAVLERNITRPQHATVPIGISQLPALPLDQSLEQVPPGKIILRIRLATPLAPTPWPHYWRARVFNFYTGRDWTTNARVGAFAPGVIEPAALPGSIVQDIEDLRSDRTIIAALPDVISINLNANREQLPDGSLAALTTDGSVSHYQVLSRPQEQAAPPALNQPPPDISSYLVLPKNYPQRVIDLAHAIVGTRTSPYAQALALETYLRTLPYSYSVQPIPTAGDAVEQFLFTMRQGYCTYYASAMAIMARSLGIPARLSIGYATGEYDPATGSYLVRQADAHAWPELYIDGRWLPFEPTPVIALPARNSGAPEYPTPVPAPLLAQQPQRSNGPLIWAVALALIVALSLALWWRSRTRPQQNLITDILQRLERGGAQAGIPWPKGATLHEYGKLLAPHARDSSGEANEVTALLGEARYSGHPLHAEQEGRLRTLTERLLARLAQLRRR